MEQGKMRIVLSSPTAERPETDSSACSLGVSGPGEVATVFPLSLFHVLHSTTSCPNLSTPRSPFSRAPSPTKAMSARTRPVPLLRAASSFTSRSSSKDTVPTPRKPKPTPLVTTLAPLSPPPLALTSPTRRSLSPSYSGGTLSPSSSCFALEAGEWDKEEEQRRIARGVMEGLRALPCAASPARRGTARDVTCESVDKLLASGYGEEERNRPRTAPLAGWAWTGIGRLSEELPRYSEQDESHVERERRELMQSMRETDRRIKEELTAFGII